MFRIKKIFKKALFTHEYFRDELHNENSGIHSFVYCASVK